MDEKNENNGQRKQVDFLLHFNLLVQASEMEIHRELICLLMEKAYPPPTVSIDAAEIHRRVDARINTKLAEMADIFPDAASAFANLLKTRQNQRKK